MPATPYYIVQADFVLPSQTNPSETVPFWWSQFLPVIQNEKTALKTFVIKIDKRASFLYKLLYHKYSLQNITFYENADNLLIHLKTWLSAVEDFRRNSSNSCFCEFKKSMFVQLCLRFKIPCIVCIVMQHKIFMEMI